MAPRGLDGRRHLLSCDRRAQALCRTAFEADDSAYPRGWSVCGAAWPSWLTAALRSVLGAQLEQEQTRDKSVGDLNVSWQQRS